MTVDLLPLVGAWNRLQAKLHDLEDSGYRVPCIDLVDLFVSDRATDREAAAEWCVECPARRACGDYAEAANEPLFVWGGVDRAPRYRGANQTKEKTRD